MLSLPAQFFDVLLAWIPDVECSYDEATYITRYALWHARKYPVGLTQGCHGRHWPACAAESGSQSMAAAAPPRADDACGAALGRHACRCTDQQDGSARIAHGLIAAGSS